MQKIYNFAVIIILSLYTIFSIIPDLMRDLDDYHKYEKVLASSHIVGTEKLARNNNHKLILTMSDQSEWIIKRTHLAYWDQINTVENVGKTFTLYTRDETETDPQRIEIDNEIIYDIDDLKLFYYIILGIFGIMILSSLINFFEKKEPETSFNS